MRKLNWLFVLVLAVPVLSCVKSVSGTDKPETPPAKQAVGFTKYVNPLIGTAPLLDPKIIGYTPPKDWRVWAGLVYPGSSLPNAMVQLSPITEFGSGAGYEYEDSVIYAFTHTNKGHWNLCNIPVLPVSREKKRKDSYGSRFSHKYETVAPGYYSVLLQDYQIQVKLTSTLRAGYHQYNYHDKEGKQILFELSKANHTVRNWDIAQDGPTAVQGFQDVGEDKVYFYATLSHSIDSLIVKQKGKKGGYALLNLGSKGSSTVEMKVGLSFVSMDNAKENLKTEIGSKSFAEVRAAANQTWENLLSTIEVTGGTARQKELFYTSLYRSFLWPALRSDVNGQYTDIKQQVTQADFNYYTLPSLWDTYRNKLVLLGIVAPQVTTDVLKSMNDMGEKSGFMPTFFHGDHAAPFITGTYLRGITGFDVKQAYKLLLRNANEEGGTRPFIKEYIEKGYIADPEVAKPHVETKGKAGVSKTLEYAYDDYALAQLAKTLGDTANFNMLMQRSGNYKNMFDPKTRFMRGRLENGHWIENFNPQYPYYEYMYREANAWQLSFFAPHDMPGLIALYGGPANFEAKLDSLFTVPWNPNYIARNVSTFIGQYCHGNQPDHEAPFAYHFIGKPEKSQQIIDKILNDFYGIGDKGLALSGMDDAGEMSAWYVFSALGLYPFSPADANYIVTVPVFDEVRWKTHTGRELVLTKPKAGRNMQAIEVNGALLQGYFVPHDLFNKGGEIRILTKE